METVRNKSDTLRVLLKDIPEDGYENVVTIHAEAAECIAEKNNQT